MAEQRFSTWPASLARSPATGRGGVILVIALGLAACVPPAAETPADVARAGAFVKTAAADVQNAARRARTFKATNNWDRAANEVEEAEVILRKAQDARDRLREAHRGAVVVLATLQARFQDDELDVSSGDYGSDTLPADLAETAATDRVERIGAILATAERDVAAIERTVEALKRLNIPGRH